MPQSGCLTLLAQSGGASYAYPSLSLEVSWKRAEPSLRDLDLLGLFTWFWLRIEWGDRVSILFPAIREFRNAPVEKFLAVMVVNL